MKAVRFLFLCGFLLVLGLGGITPLLGQGDITLTIAVPEWTNDIFNAALFGEFEAAHPGVKVQLSKTGGDPVIPSAADDLDAHLMGVEQYAASADVLHVGAGELTPFSTRAGYFLNLAPLIETDPNFAVDDFLPAAWQSVQWDRGTWSIPVNAYALMILYDVDAFDIAGLTYPDATWTFDQFADAARKLTQKNADNAVEKTGFWVSNPAYFIRSLVGKGFYDSTVLPNPPSFSDPELISVLESWLELQEEIMPLAEVNPREVPMIVGTPRQVAFDSFYGQHNWAVAPLPGGTTELVVQGFAISSGTQYPELAYELVKYLSANPILISRFFGDTAVRYSLADVKPEEDLFSLFEASDETQAVIDAAVGKAFPTSELRFADYLSIAIRRMQNEGVDIQIALQEAETTALSALDTAEQLGSEAIIAVATPIAAPQAAEGEITLKFGYALYSQELPNSEQWYQLMDEFVASNPQVGGMDFQTKIYLPGELTERDCFFFPVNMVPWSNPATLVSLDPFLDADPNFDADDVLGDSMLQLQKEGRTYGYPIVLQPAVLMYDYERFLRDGVMPPEGNWDIDAFNDALNILRSTSEPGSKPFVPQSFTNQYLLMLIAAYGGTPYDYRTNPPTLSFTDPVNVDAIRQVLDLAKDEYLDYRPLANLVGGLFGGAPPDAPILGQIMSSISVGFIFGQQEEEGERALRITNYPHGSAYVPVSYDIGSGYIGANATNPQVCYDWITTIADHPELFSGIPARRSMLNDPTVLALQGADVAGFYASFVERLDDPHRLIFPGAYSKDGNVVGFVEQMWLNEAFDNYVLHDGDLEADLADAELYIKAFRDCSTDLPPFSEANYTTQMEAIKFMRQYLDCAIEIDPAKKDLFALFYLGQ